MSAPFKTPILYFSALFILSFWNMDAQNIEINSRVISSGGNFLQKGQLLANSTVGETIIFSRQNTGIYLGQGFQATHPLMLTTSIATETKVIELRVYPNPFSQDLFLDGEILPDQIDLYNLQGICVSSIKSPSSRITQLGHLPDGLYMVIAIYQNNHYPIGKIIKINP